MFKQIMLAMVGLLMFGSNAFAFQWMNCSNADGSLKRVETEIWGANPVEWLSNGETVVDAQEEFNDAKKVVLEKIDRTKVSVDEVFATQVTVSATAGNAEFRVTDFVICKSHKDQRRD